jgi:cytoskeletal protein RodZ
MASFGENLQREREMRGVTLQEISAATKIGVRFLKALEAEDFGQVPGGIFTRSFIRTYAKYLGLDEDRVLAEYQLVAQPKADFDLNRMTSSRLYAPRQGSRGPLLALFLAAVLIGGGYGVFRYSHRAAEIASSARPPVQATPNAAAPTPPPQQTLVPAPASDSTQQAADQTAAMGQGSASASTTPAATSGSLSAAPSTTASLPEPAGGLVLQVAATEPSWVAIEADGKVAFQRILSPSEIQTFKARESFDVTTGNALGIILTLNGETLKPLGRRGEVKSIHLTHNDVKKTLP